MGVESSVQILGGDFLDLPGVSYCVKERLSIPGVHAIGVEVGEGPYNMWALRTLIFAIVFGGLYTPIQGSISEST